MECTVEGCDRIATKRALCNTHYIRLRRWGSIDPCNRNSNGSGGLSTGGYWLISVNGRRVYEHIFLAEKALGKPLPKGAVVHHMNENKLDNETPFNLIVCPSREYHMLLHDRMRRFGYPST